MFNHGTPNPGALLMIHVMCVFGVVVFAFGIYCIVQGIKEWFK